MTYWTPGGTASALASYLDSFLPEPDDAFSTYQSPAARTSTWTSGGASYTASESDTWTDAWVASSTLGGGWSFQDTGLATYSVTITGGTSPTTASGSLYAVLSAEGGAWEARTRSP